MSNKPTNEKAEKRNLNRTQTQARAHRREEAEREWRINPIGKYREENSNLTQKDLTRKIKTLREFEEFLLWWADSESRQNYEVLGVRDTVRQDVEVFRDKVLKPRPDFNDRTIENHLSRLNMFFNALEKASAIAGNPARKPLEDFRENHDTDAGRPYIPFHRVRRFLCWLDRPYSRAMWLLAFKQGLRTGEAINLDLRCLHIDHPVFWRITDNHDVALDPRIRDKPDTILIYGEFNEKTVIPNDDTAGFEGKGEEREVGNKRKQENGSVLPIDSELKTALIEWLLVRPTTGYREIDVHPLFTSGGTANTQRLLTGGMRDRLWNKEYHPDSIQIFQQEAQLDECPTCGEEVIEENLKSGEKTGRRFRCRKCHQTHWRSIYWQGDLATEQKMTYHQGRTYFSSAHTPANSGIHDGAIPDEVRKKGIRGDSNNQGDTEDIVYIKDEYRNFDEDIREPYLDGIYKFEIYDDVIPAVGEGWDP